MKLSRPLVSFDLEVTGLDPEEDRIVEVAAIKLMPDGKKIEKTACINPERPIPAEATEVHGIKDEDVADAPTFRRIARSLWKFLDGCDLTGYNVARFDVPFLAAEFKRCSIEWPAEDAVILDAYSIAVRQESRDLAWALKFYTGKDHSDNHHSALPDAHAALDVLLAQSQKYLVQPESGDVDPVTVEDMQILQSDPDWVDGQGKFKKVDDDVVITFGKHKDRVLKDIPGSYLSWMLKGDFLSDAKQVAREELERRRQAVRLVKEA